MNRIARAREVLPLPRLLQRLGLGVHATKNTECPFCHARKKFGVYESKAHGGHWFFKCYNNECAANDADGGHSEIGFLILLRGCSEADAIEEFMRLATEVDPSLADTKLYHAAAAPALGRILTETTQPLNPWHDTWQRLPLIADHNEALSKKRGFTEATIKALGFRSSIAANEHIADPLIEKWGDRALIELGIVKNEKEGLKLNPQLHGLGITGKKNADGENKMGWVNPIIIPYLDAEGIPFYLRPHKGGLKRQHRDQWYKEQVGGSVYCPYLLTSLIEENNGVCIVTEGEFKAGALWQCRIPALAVPGIQFTRSRAGDISMPEYRFRNELVALLRQFGVTDVIVAFDNEIKDDPTLPSYKPDPWDRYDTVVWAEYLSWDLRGEFESIRIGHIPDAWRIDGKADFDSALAGFVHGAMSGKVKHPAFDFGHGEKEGTRKARKAFRTIIDESQEKKGYHELFASAARKIIDCKLERLFYSPRVPSGGDMEEKLARRFSEPNPLKSKPGKPVAIDSHLADAFKSVKGCYYKRGSVDAKAATALRKLIETIDAQIETEERQHEAPAPGKIALFKTVDEVLRADDSVPPEDLNIEHLKALRSEKAAAWERIKGIPEPLSDFTISCEYKLHTSDGKTIRLVKIRNQQGQTNDKHLRLDATAMCRTSNFREWAYDTGLGVPMFGEKDLQSLVLDMDHHSAWRDIYDVTTYGLHHQSGLWFYGDCAVTPEGAILETDQQGNIWYEGVGYQVEAPMDENELSTGFEQGAPKLLSPNGPASELNISDRDLFDHLADDFLEMVGGYDAWGAIGLFFASAFAPEMLALYNGQPGIFLHGNLSEGKTTTIRLLMRLHGFKHLDGLSIEPTTEVAMARALSHYSCLYIWFDEFRQQNLKDRPGKLTIIRDAFNRGSAAKGYAHDPRKTRMVRPNTTACVTGETRTSDGATLSRFCVIQIAKMRRGANSEQSLDRAQRESPHYYRLWKYIMVNRQKFSDMAMATLAVQYEKHKEALPTDRIRFVHMAGYAAFTTLATMLESTIADPSSEVDRIGEFETAIVAHAQRAFQDVNEETFIQSFWRMVISGVQNNEIKRKFFKTRVMIRKDDDLRPCTDQELRDGAISKITICCIMFQPVYDAYSIYIRKQGANPQMSASDLRRGMTTEKWCLKTKVEHFAGEGSIRALVISLEPEDQFPFIEELTDIPPTTQDHSDS